MSNLHSIRALHFIICIILCDLGWKTITVVSCKPSIETRNWLKSKSDWNWITIIVIWLDMICCIACVPFASRSLWWFSAEYFSPTKQFMAYDQGFEYEEACSRKGEGRYSLVGGKRPSRKVIYCFELCLYVLLTILRYFTLYGWASIEEIWLESGVLRSTSSPDSIF